MGSLVLEALRTEVKKTSVVVFMTASATPVVLLNETVRPLTATMYWLGPTAPSQSGGNELVGLVPLNVAPVKLTPTVCGLKTRNARPSGDGLVMSWFPGLGGIDATCGDAGFCGRPLRS